LLPDRGREILRAGSTSDANVRAELCWWRDLATLWPDMQNTGLCTPSNADWLTAAADRLAKHADFNWNRATQDGRVRLDDTINTLHEGRAELQRNTSSEDAG